MNRRYLFTLSSVIYFVCLCALFVIFAGALNLITFAHGEKIFTGILAVISGYAAAVLMAFSSEDNKREKIIKNQLIFTFIFYLIMLIDFTLIDEGMGRNIFNVFSWNAEAFGNYLNTSTNMVPFKTVMLFINGYKDGNVGFLVMHENIFGNFVAFMPLAFFVSCLFKRFSKWYSVLITVTVSVVAVELLQLLFLTGASDIDDVILNVAGAMCFYAVLRIKKISCMISKFTFGVWKTVENKD
ncbi:MAG: VanZ family protein [Acutalibacteraceae bacterium]|nr:VanZ family protein [Acutalibacteraceae bacterium]